MKKLLTTNTALLSKLLVGVLLLAATVAAGYFYYQYQQVQQQNPAHEIETITAEIGKTLQLPEEEPNLATVTDKTLLAEQPFFAQAENGDKVLIYRSWGKAILYRPSTQKIIDITNVTADVNAELTTDSQETIPETISYTVYLLNGTTQAGATREIDAQITSVANITIVGRDNAERSTYTQTLVIPLAEASAAAAQKIADTLSAELSTLPAGETAPEDADIVVIVGGSAATPTPTTTPEP